MKTLALVKSLTKEEVKNLQTVPPVKNSRILQNLLLALHKLALKDQPYDKTGIYEATFGEPYDPKKDHVLRKRLTDLNKCIEDFFVRTAFTREAANQSSLKSLFLLKEYQNRKLTTLFDAEFEPAYKRAKDNLQPHLAAEMLGVLFERRKSILTDMHAIKGFGKQAREQRQLHIQHANRAIKTAEMMIIFFENGALQHEDRDLNYTFDHFQSIDLALSENSDPMTDYLYQKSLQLLGNEPSERIAILEKCLHILEQCKVDGFNYHREASIMHHSTCVAYIESKKWQEALNHIQQSAALEMQYLGKNTPLIILCQSLIFHQLKQYREVIALAQKHRGEFDDFSNDFIQMQGAYAHLKFRETDEVRKIIGSLGSDSDQVDTSAPGLLAACLYQEGELEAAITTHENLVRRIRDRKNKGLYDYYHQALLLAGKFYKIRSEPKSEQQAALIGLKKELINRLNADEVSNTELYMFDWLVTQIEEALR